jgi:hypothetical protein
MTVTMVQKQLNTIALPKNISLGEKLYNYFFTDPEEAAAYNRAHKGYTDLLSKAKDLFNQRTYRNVEAYIWLHYDSRHWPLVNALIDCANMQKACEKILNTINESQNHQTSKKNKNLIRNRNAMRRLLQPSLKTIQQITSFIIWHPFYPAQAKQFQKYQESLKKRAQEPQEEK